MYLFAHFLINQCFYMRKYVHTLLALLLPLAAFCQFETDYKPVVSRGALPKDFVTLSSDKYVMQKAELGKGEKKAARKSKEKFLLESNFGLDEMLLSGKTVFNDPLAEYVNKVADKLLATDPVLRSQLRFYILRSSEVNAFATNQGVIFVTMGMLAQLENEAQLAFILAHEAVHFTHNHAMERFLEEEQIERGRGSYEDLAFDDQILAKCAFSKDQEKDADESGTELFFKSQYSTQHVIGVYDVLKYSYLPFDDITFDKSFFENSTLKFPEGYILTQTKPIETKDIDDDDDRSTHPSIPERRDYTEKAIKKANNAGKSDYIVGEGEFKKVREMARFELCRLYTLRQKYEAGIYTSYMLLKKYPNNLYLKKNIVYCLAGLTEYSNEDDFSEVHKKYEKKEGKGQAVYYLMHKLDSIKGDLNVVALAYALKLKNEYPQDKEIDEVYRRLIKGLIDEAERGYASFSESAPLAVAPTNVFIPEVKDDTVVNELSQSKYDKLRQQETEVKQTGKLPFTDYAFVEFMEDGKLKRDFDKANKEKDAKKNERENESDARKAGKRKLYALGVDKIVVVDPYFARIDSRKKNEFKYLESEHGQVDFAERLKTNAKKAKLEIEVLNTKNLVETETDKVNEISLLEEYISERLDHDKEINMPYPERDRIRAIAQKYGTENFVWIGAISGSQKMARARAGLIVLSVLVPPSILFTLPRLINAGHYTVYFALMYNVETDELKYSTFREIQNRTKGYILNSNIYDSFNQIKTKKKEKKK